MRDEFFHFNSVIVIWVLEKSPREKNAFSYFDHIYRKQSEKQVKLENKYKCNNS